MLAFRDETKDQELWVLVKCKPGTEVLASASQRQWWHLQSSTSVIRPKGTCLTIIINCSEIQFLHLHRRVSRLKINQDIIIPALKGKKKKVYSGTQQSFFIPGDIWLRGILKICNLMCLLQPRRLCLSILIVIPFFNIDFEGSIIHCGRITGPTSSRRMLIEIEHQLNCVRLVFLAYLIPHRSKVFKIWTFQHFPWESVLHPDGNDINYLNMSGDIRIIGKKKNKEPQKPQRFLRNQVLKLYKREVAQIICRFWVPEV